MKRDLPAYVYRRKGGILYFERRGQKSVRIVAEPGTAAFALEYARAMNGTEPVPTRASFRGLVASYRKTEAFQRLAPRTSKEYDVVLDWIIKNMGDLPVAAIRKPDVIRARDAQAAKWRFANYIVQILRIILKHATEIGWRDDNPAQGVPLLTKRTDDRQPWPLDLVKAARAKAKGRTLLILELCLGTGQRIGDVLKMRWDDLQDGGLLVRQNKTKARLWIPLTAQLRAVLVATPKAGLTICAQPNGKPTSYRGAADMVMALRRAIGAEAYDIHGLRYTAAAELGAAGCSDEVIASITGHKSMAMVAKYAGPERQKARARQAQDSRK